MGAVATAWLATQHQQLMYLLSPEGKTVFYIPGVEVVHTVSTPINLPDEKIKMEAGKMQPPPGGGGCPHCVHPDQPSRRKDQDGGWKDAAASRGQQETRSWPLPRPQLCLRQEEQAGAEPPHLPGRADAQANIPRAREVPHPEPDPGHPNPIGLHIPKISDGGAGDVCQGFRRGPRAPAAV